jgi:hypothetical protein
MSTVIYALAATDAQANTIVTALKSAGFPGNDISVLFPHATSGRDFAPQQNTKAPEGAAVGGISGSVVGGALGWMAGIGLLTIPGVGPFIAAGPILALLSGAALGAAAGGLTGSFIGLGMPEVDAKRYETQVRAGRILIAVHADNHDWTNKAKQVLKDAGGDDISSSVNEATTIMLPPPSAQSAQHAAKR